MKNYLTVLICLFAMFAHGQKIKSITKKHKNPFFTEKYDVLKSDISVKHGSFKKISSNNYTEIEGYYHYGKKDSTWTTYFKGSDQIKSQGTYKNDERIGEWRFYSGAGQLLQIYNFSLSNLVYTKPPEKPREVVVGDSLYTTILVMDPQYVGSAIALYDYIVAGQLDLGRDPSIQLASGLVEISFFINEHGVAHSYSLDKGISDALDKRCMDIVTGIPDKWIAGQDEKGAVHAKYTVYLKFNYKIM